MIDFKGSLEKGLDTLSDIFKMKYASEYVEKIQPTLIQGYQQIALPTLIIIVLAVIILWKWK